VKVPKERLNASCGLFCADSLPSRREFFDQARRLQALLQQHHIGEDAAVRARRIPVFHQYGVFLEVLSARVTLPPRSGRIPIQKCI
jgi:hypothetical protein